MSKSEIKLYRCDEAEELIELGLAIAQSKRQPEPAPKHCAICSDRLAIGESDICNRHETEPANELWP